MAGITLKICCCTSKARLAERRLADDDGDAAAAAAVNENERHFKTTDEERLREALFIFPRQISVQDRMMAAERMVGLE